MADDLKLQVVIEALLDAKGFEDAKANLEKLATTANKTAPSVQKMGESFGGTRGPVADVTRVLLQNVGVTGAAGEAAKAAGTAMYFLEGAATAQAVALTGGVALFALLIPKIIEYATRTDASAEATNRLRKELLDALPSLHSMQDALGELTRLQRGLLEIQQEKAIAEQRKQVLEFTKAAEGMREEINKLLAPTLELEGRIQRGGAATFRQVEATEENKKKAAELSIELLDLEVQIAALNEATEKGTTLTDAYSDAQRRAKDSAKGAKQESRDLEAFLRQEAAARHRQQELLLDNERSERKEMEDLKVRRQQMLLDYERAQKAMARAEADRIGDSILAEAELAQFRRDAYRETIAGGLGAMAALFEGNKAIAIAAAIAETYVAANRAFAAGGGWPLGAAMMAVTIAQGMANVEQIRKQKVGFDDPFADMTARRLGRKSAVDFVANFGAGFHSGMGMAMGGGTTQYHTTVNRGTTVNMGTINGIIGPKTEFRKWLSSEITKAERLERRRTVGR